MQKEGKRNGGKKGHETAGENSSDTGSIVTIDFEKYEKILAKSKASDETKRELIQVLCKIMRQFVALGWRIDSTQLAQSACGEDQEKSPNSALTAPDGVDWDNQNLIANFLSADVFDETASKGVDS